VKYIYITVILGLGFNLTSQINAPKYSNEFLNIGVGARSLAMSNSVITSTNSAMSGYLNPANLIKNENDIQIGLMHAEYFAGIAKYDFGSISKRIDDKSSFGFSFLRFGVDNIPNTSELIDAQGNVNYDRVSYFSAADLAFIGSYARKLNKYLSVGGSAKIINRKAGDFASAWGFGIDLSSTYSKNDWSFALVAKDITSTFNVWKYQLSNEMISTFISTGNELPQNGIELTLPKLILGASKEFHLKNNINFLIELNTDISTDGKRNVLISGNPFSIDPHFGAEISIKNIVFIRAGVGNIQKTPDLTNKIVYTIQPNLGLGINIKGIEIEYALTDIGDVSIAEYSNIFSLKFNINSK
tara:strand:- start:301 stop:1368 length:1068 start_codon:yes stop_codon:yes gene_type:complete